MRHAVCRASRFRPLVFSGWSLAPDRAPLAASIRNSARAGPNYSASIHYPDTTRFPRDLLSEELSGAS
jgi:hypothetical protein